MPILSRDLFTMAWGILIFLCIIFCWDDGIMVIFDSWSLITEENVCDKSLIECCGNTPVAGVFYHILQCCWSWDCGCIWEKMQRQWCCSVIKIAFGRECRVKASVVGLDVLVIVILAEDGGRNRKSNFIWKLAGSTLGCI